jgi:O-antigen/teichoic acid export membrane protein
VPQLHPEDAERTLRLYQAQRSRGVLALVLMFALLLGLPLVFAIWPELDSVRLLDIPVSWLMLAVFPYPAMLLARWQLRRAERVEER